MAMMDSGKLWLTEEEWIARMKERWSGEGSSSHGSDNKLHRRRRRRSTPMSASVARGKTSN
jgi:hypothetical protein